MPLTREYRLISVPDTRFLHCNIHILKDGVFYTHPADCHILPGIARAHLIGMCGKLGIPVIEQPFTLDTLRGADEIIVSSSGDFCVRACELDGAPIGGKAPARLKALQDAIWQEFLEDTKQI